MPYSFVCNNSTKILRLSSSGYCGWVGSWHEDFMWGAALPPKPGSSNVSSTGSNWSMKSSWQLTTVPLGAWRSNVPQKPDHLLLCLCPVLLHQADGRDPQQRHRTAGKHHSALHPDRSCWWRDTAHQGPASSTNEILPTSSGHTLAAQKPRESHSCPTSPMGICRQLLLTPAAVGKSWALPWRGVTIHLAKIPQTGFLSAALGEYTTRHYQKLWVRDKLLFLSDSLLFNPFTKIFGCKTFLQSLELIKTCQSTASFDCSFCNLTPHRETYISLPKSSHQIHKYSERTLIFTI